MSTEKLLVRLSILERKAREVKECSPLPCRSPQQQKKRRQGCRKIGTGIANFQGKPAIAKGCKRSA
jgi:hypothetical protein